MTTYLPSHLGMCVSDLDRSLRFYCDGLGFEKADRHQLASDQLPGLEKNLEVRDDVVLTLQIIERGDLRIELLEFSEPGVVGSPTQRRNQLGLTHLAFFVDDVDVAAERMLEHGALVLDDTRANLGTDVVFLMDPDGVRIQLVRGAPPPTGDA
jgi:catechol 2,3-dioxygenase-like lactoylglutathione lyase family enzyme